MCLARCAQSQLHLVFQRSTSQPNSSLSSHSTLEALQSLPGYLQIRRSLQNEIQVRPLCCFQIQKYRKVLLHSTPSIIPSLGFPFHCSYSSDERLPSQITTQYSFRWALHSAHLGPLDLRPIWQNHLVFSTTVGEYETQAQHCKRWIAAHQANSTYHCNFITTECSRTLTAATAINYVNYSRPHCH